MATNTTMAADLKLHDLFQGEYETRLISAVAITLVILIWGYVQFLAGPNLSKFPHAGKAPGWFSTGLAAAKRDFLANGPKILNEGYRKYKNGSFVIQTLNVPRIVLNAKYVEEINRTVPEDHLSMADGLRERLLSSQTNLDVVFGSPLHIDVCKAPLTQNLHKLIAPINEEAGYWLSQRIPGKMEVKAYDLIVRVISATASRMLGGTTISRNPEWLETAAAYSMDVVSVAVKLRPYPAFMRPLIAPWLEGTKTLDRHLKTTKKCFSPIFKERLAAIESGVDLGQDKPVDMVQWMAEGARGSDRDIEVLSHNMLFLALAGVHTSSATTIHALFDLCANPEYIGPIREEIQSVTAEHGWTLSAIAGMKRLDSFMKESQRLNQAVLMTFNRKVIKPVRLSDGTTLPKGAYITLPSDSVARDPDIYANPDHFDGFRFYEKRMSSKTEANRHQFATVGPESLAFGQGKQACPGRFFAGVQIKAVIANILANYDISFPEGQTARPKNIHKGGLVRPDPRQKLVFTPRK